MAKLNDFLSQVTPFLPACSEMLAIQHIRETCRDFCQFTGVWQETLDPVATSYGIRRYDLSPPPNASIVRTVKVWHRNTELPLMNSDSRLLRPELYNDLFPNASNTPGIPRTALVDFENTQLAVDPAPNMSEPNALTVRVVLKPSRTATTVPDLLLNEYEYAIAQGAISRLAKVPSQPFTDTNIALAAAVEYRTLRHDAAIRANQNFSRSQTTVRGRPFA